ncbi:mucin-2-like isoform X2 [Rhopalosiphum padi]|uniref:mucin-2-like isoform X2 n=1 Tax=Rhopalosiphum padi TaxID=40932 RepID=UPI00298DF773|nr:mucin-2-like isoform X2 [Rhopalosiphum padi]
MHKQDSTSALFRGLYVSLTPFEQCLAYCVTNNSNIVDKRSTAINSLQQAAELLDRCQKLLQAANAEAASHATTEADARATTEAAARATTEAAARATTEAAARATTEAAARATTEAAAHATTAARVRRMPTAELRRDPVLWVAYTRGWDDHALVYSKSTNVGPKTAVTGRSQTPRQPARTPRPPPMPQSTPLLRPPPPTINGSTGPTTKIVQTARSARNEESGPAKCSNNNTGRTDDNSATTKFEATLEPVSDAGIPGTEKGCQSHHLPTVPPGKTGTLNHPTGTRPNVAGVNRHACPRGQDTGGSNAY